MTRGRRIASWSAIIIGIFSLWAWPSRDAWPEVKGSYAGLFWVDVPLGWQWREDAEGVSLVSPGGRRTMRIDAQAQEGIDTEEGAKALVEQAMAAKIREIVSMNGKTVAKRERRVDGVFALQTGFLLPASEEIHQATAIFFYAKKYLFCVYLEASREPLRLEMEEIADTIRFEPPKPQDTKRAQDR